MGISEWRVYAPFLLHEIFRIEKYMFSRELSVYESTVSPTLSLRRCSYAKPCRLHAVTPTFVDYTVHNIKVRIVRTYVYSDELGAIYTHEARFVRLEEERWVVRSTCTGTCSAASLVALVRLVTIFTSRTCSALAFLCIAQLLSPIYLFLSLVTRLIQLLVCHSREIPDVYFSHFVLQEGFSCTVDNQIFTFSSYTEYVKKESIVIAWVKKKILSFWWMFMFRMS